MPQFGSAAQFEARKDLLRRGVYAHLEQGARLEVVLDRLIENVEAQATQMLAAIFFYDPTSRTLSVGAGPNMQPGYLKAVNGFNIGPLQPACGSAVFKRERVITRDVRTDPLWDNYRHFAEAFQVRAVWSEPILSDAKDVLGTLAFYFKEPKEPDASELVILEYTAALAGMAIQKRSDEVRAIIDARKIQFA